MAVKRSEPADEGTPSTQVREPAPGHDKNYVQWFRDSSPYINAHRRKTFVIHVGGEALAHTNFDNIVHDLALLNTLGVRLVLVHGASPQEEEELATRGITLNHHDGIPITDSASLAAMEAAVGRLRLRIEARLSMGLVNSPMHGAGIQVVTGNFITAQPFGVHEGIDFQHTGQLRHVKGDVINAHLANGAIVLLSPLGYSATGEIFRISSEELAMGVSIALSANKLIYFIAEQGVLDRGGSVINELQPDELAPLIASRSGENEGSTRRDPLELAGIACRGGVDRCHLISYADDGALLEELFTRDGAGTQVCMESYEQIRRATIEDVGGIIELIRPLEERGILIRRSRERLEAEIDRFTVIIRDGMVVACAALYPFGRAGELACLATHADYRNGDRGELLLGRVEQEAKRMGLDQLFVLTTQSAHWFQERGYIPGDLDSLPEQRKLLYNFQRNSKIFRKTL